MINHLHRYDTNFTSNKNSKATYLLTTIYNSNKNVRYFKVSKKT